MSRHLRRLNMNAIFKANPHRIFPLMEQETERRSERKPLPLLGQYIGSKHQAMRKLVHHIPPHDRYVSLFGGIGSEFAVKEQSEIEVFNDIDRNLVAVFRILQDPDHLPRLVARIQCMPNSRVDFYEARALLCTSSATDFQRAYATLVVLNHMYRAAPIAKASWTPSHATRNLRRNLRDFIQQWAERVRDVALECESWRFVLDRYDSETTCFFVDPPYHPETVKNQCYSHTMTRDEHHELLIRLRKVKGFVMLCGYEHESYDALLWDWRRMWHQRKASKGRTSKKEVVWMNFESDYTKISKNQLLVAVRFAEAVGGIEKGCQLLRQAKSMLEPQHNKNADEDTSKERLQ